MTGCSIGESERNSSNDELDYENMPLDEYIISEDNEYASLDYDYLLDGYSLDLDSNGVTEYLKHENNELSLYQNDIKTDNILMSYSHHILEIYTVSDNENNIYLAYHYSNFIGQEKWSQNITLYSFNDGKFAVDKEITYSLDFGENPDEAVVIGEDLSALGYVTFDELYRRTI